MRVGVYFQDDAEAVGMDVMNQRNEEEGDEDDDRGDNGEVCLTRWFLWHLEMIP